MFPRNKTTANSPDMGGEITIRTEVLNYILQQAQNGSQEVEVRVAMWRGQSKAGLPMSNLVLELPDENRQQGAPRQQYSPQGQRQQGYPNQRPQQGPQQGLHGGPQGGYGTGYPPLQHSPQRPIAPDYGPATNQTTHHQSYNGPDDEPWNQ